MESLYSQFYVLYFSQQIHAVSILGISRIVQSWISKLTRIQYEIK